VIRPIPGRTQGYVPIPRRLVLDEQDSPLSIGLYLVVARLSQCHQEAIPVSASDIPRWDPMTHQACALRALQRLVRDSWLASEVQPGRKTRYCPTWGRISDQPRLWAYDAPKLGRPPHVHTLRVDRQLLDDYLGKLTPHERHPAQRESWFNTPLLSLVDIGSYVLTLAGLPQTTPRLLQWGLVSDTQPQPLPPLLTLLQQVSDALPDHGDPQLSDQGRRRLVEHPSAYLNGRVIGHLIEPKHVLEASFRQAETDESPCASLTQPIPGTLKNRRELTMIPPTPPQAGGGVQRFERKKENPETETARLLQELNVRPAIVHELAGQPLNWIEGAIADGTARTNVRDLAGWVVSMVRDARDYGWEIAVQKRTGTAGSPGLTEASLRASIERAKASGLFLSDDDLVEDDDQIDLSVALQSPPKRSNPSIEDEKNHNPGPPGGGVPLAAGVFHAALRKRARPSLWSLIDQLQVAQRGAVLELQCQTAAQVGQVQEQLLPRIGGTLRELGWTAVPHIQVLVRAERRSAPSALVGSGGAALVSQGQLTDPRSSAMQDQLLTSAPPQAEDALPRRGSAGPMLNGVPLVPAQPRTWRRALSLATREQAGAIAIGDGAPAVPQLLGERVAGGVLAEAAPDGVAQELLGIGGAKGVGVAPGAALDAQLVSHSGDLPFDPPHQAARVVEEPVAARGQVGDDAGVVQVGDEPAAATLAVGDRDSLTRPVQVLLAQAGDLGDAQAGGEGQAGDQLGLALQVVDDAAGISLGEAHAGCRAGRRGAQVVGDERSWVLVPAQRSDAVLELAQGGQGRADGAAGETLLLTVGEVGAHVVVGEVTQLLELRVDVVADPLNGGDGAIAVGRTGAVREDEPLRLPRLFGLMAGLPNPGNVVEGVVDLLDERTSHVPPLCCFPALLSAGPGAGRAPPEIWHTGGQGAFTVVRTVSASI
jgi:hypothetical protein